MAATISLTGCTLRTYIYEILDVQGRHLKWVPTSPSGASFAYSVLGDVSDTTPPAAVSDLEAAGRCPADGNVDLVWTAPGDDGGFGTATSYNLRYSSSPITDANPGTSYAIAAPRPAGTLEQATVYLGTCTGSKYFAFRAVDEVGNVSGLSNEPSADPGCPPNGCGNKPQSGQGNNLSSVPTTTEFGDPEPNPARVNARVRLGIPQDQEGAAYEVSVFDVSGRLARVLERGNARAGRFALDWDLNSDEGHPVRGGIYFLRFTLGGVTETRRLLVLR